MADSSNNTSISYYFLSITLYYINLYLLIFSIVTLFIYYTNFSNNNTNFLKSFEKSILLKKNLILTAFLLSFCIMLFTLRFNFLLSNIDLTQVLESNIDSLQFFTQEFLNYENFESLPNTLTLKIDSINNFLASKVITAYINTGLSSVDVVLILLCYIIGFFSFLVLGDRVWLNNSNAIILLLYFPLIILLLTQASSLIEMFLYYELLMLPSVFLVNKLSYSNKSHTANLYFFIWTQIGSIITLFAILYINANYSSTSFNFLQNVYFSESEQYYLFLLLFLGFGVKVPIWPFHYWLTKVHVEAPSGFSMFLSGFLVKTAIVCFYKMLLTLNIIVTPIIPIVICAIGILDASLKFWGQVDIKKLIAYATIQEMNCIYILFLGDDSWAIRGGLVFLVAHGLLSALMFYIIELLYKRTSSRSLYKIAGLSELYPNLAIIIWVMLIIFLGFPGTAKFFAEFFLISMFVEFNILFGLFIGFFVIFIGGVGFAKCWFSILYGHGGYNKVNLDLTKEESYISGLLALLSILSPILFYFF